MVGACSHSVNNLKLTPLGMIIASVSVLAASLYQVWVGERLKAWDMNSSQLLYYQVPLLAVLLIPCIMIMETLASYQTKEEHQTALIAVTAPRLTKLYLRGVCDHDSIIIFILLHAATLTHVTIQADRYSLTVGDGN